MAVPKPPLVWFGTNNFDSGVYAKDRIILHWAVTRMSGMDSMASYANERSSTPTYMVDGEHRDKIHQYSDMRARAWHAGSQNSRSVGIETAGGWLTSGGYREKPSQATHELTAWLCAYIADQLGLGRLVVGQNLFGHNSFMSTECPGSLDMQWIANRANQYLTGTAGSITEPEKEADMAAAPILKGIRNTKTGACFAVNPITGQAWHFPSPAYAELWKARGWVSDLQDLAPNEVDHYLQIHASLAEQPGRGQALGNAVTYASWANTNADKARQLAGQAVTAVQALDAKVSKLVAVIPTTPAPAPTVPSVRTHSVKSGETLWGIASSVYGAANAAAGVARILSANPGTLTLGQPISVGTIIVIPSA